MNGCIPALAVIVVACSYAVTVIDACSQPANATYLNMPALVQKADLVISGRNASESVVVQRAYKSGQIYQKVVDITFRNVSTLRVSQAVAASGCLPNTITVRGVVLLSACVDIRRQWRIGGDYILALKYQSGTYTLLDQSQLCMWSLTDANMVDVQQTPLASGQQSGAPACSSGSSATPAVTVTPTVKTTNSH